jgi:hypothetical protein
LHHFYRIHRKHPRLFQECLWTAVTILIRPRHEERRWLSFLTETALFPCNLISQVLGHGFVICLRLHCWHLSSVPYIPSVKNTCHFSALQIDIKIDFICFSMCVFQGPANHAERESIEHGFRTRRNFPGCHGDIDGKHVWFKPLLNAEVNFGTTRELIVLRLLIMIIVLDI